MKKLNVLKLKLKKWSLFDYIFCAPGTLVVGAMLYFLLVIAITMPAEFIIAVLMIIACFVGIVSIFTLGLKIVEIFNEF